MITPLRLAFMELLKTDLLILNVPIVSISITVLKPFMLSFSILAKKFPAAPLTRISILPKR